MRVSSFLFFAMDDNLPMKSNRYRFFCPLLASLILSSAPAWAASEAQQLRERQSLNLLSPDEKKSQEQQRKIYVEDRQNANLLGARDEVRTNPDNWYAHYNLAGYAMQNNQFDEAEEAIKRAETLAPREERGTVEKLAKTIKTQRASAR